MHDLIWCISVLNYNSEWLVLFVAVTMVVGESKRTANIMDGIENTGDVRMHDHRLRLKQR